MIKYFCDRCEKELDRSYRAHISYSGNEEAYFCKECNEEFLNWMKNNPVKNDEKKIEDYERTIHSYERTIHSYEEVIHNYQEAVRNYRQQIKDLTEHLAKQGQIVTGDENYKRAEWDGKAHIMLS